MLLAHHRAFRTDLIEIAPRIGNDLRVFEKIGFHVRHGHLPTALEELSDRLRSAPASVETGFTAFAAGLTAAGRGRDSRLAGASSRGT